MEWEQFIQDMGVLEGHPWKQGQHIALIGKTGCGKTTLANALLPMRKYVAVIATKPKSESLDKFAATNGYVKYQRWPGTFKEKKVTAQAYPRRILWPPSHTISQALTSQRAIVGAAFNDIYGTGGWCIYVDELRFISETLGLKFAVELFVQQGRELGISFIGGMQRPKFVPLSIYANSSHFFFWQEKDVRNLETISAINSVDSFFIRNVMTQLPEHEFLYIHSPDGYMCRSMAPDPNGSQKGGDK